MASLKPLLQKQPSYVVGASQSGQSIARYLLEKGRRVILSDIDPHITLNEIKSSLSKRLTFLSGHHDANLIAAAEEVILSPGIAPESEAGQLVTSLGKTPLSSAEWVASELHAPLVVVTGTCGKTTLLDAMRQLICLEPHVKESKEVFLTDRSRGDGLAAALSQRPKRAVIAEFSVTELASVRRLEPALLVITSLESDNNHTEYHSFDEYLEAKFGWLRQLTQPLPVIAQEKDRSTLFAFLRRHALPTSLLQFYIVASSKDPLLSAAQSIGAIGEHLGLHALQNPKAILKVLRDQLIARCESIGGFPLPLINIGPCKNSAALLWTARALSSSPRVITTRALPSDPHLDPHAILDLSQESAQLDQAFDRWRTDQNLAEAAPIVIDESVRQHLFKVFRPCPLCGSFAGHRISEETWDVLGLGLVRLGFRVCSPCGLVLQDPAVPREKMLAHYAAFSNYTNPSRDGRPSPQKERNVARQVGMVRAPQNNANRLFQIGCSDGYTLNEFKQQGWDVSGIDPSSAAQKIAQGRYGIRTLVGDFESAEGLGTFDLLVATHVLEHVYDPVAFLQKAARLLNPKGILLLEVPCLTYPEKWPNGYFAFEHVQYFSETTLKACLARAGFQVETTDVRTEALAYPIICVIASPQTGSPSLSDDEQEYARAMAIVETHQRAEEASGWTRIETNILPRLDRHRSICLWGAGIHTSQLISRTTITQRPVSFIVDSDSQKHGQKLAGYDVLSPQAILERGIEAVVISTAGSEADVYAATQSLRDRGVQVYRLYADEAGHPKQVDSTLTRRSLS